jgi:hypothetical protein
MRSPVEHEAVRPRYTAVKNRSVRSPSSSSRLWRVGEWKDGAIDVSRQQKGKLRCTCARAASEKPSAPEILYTPATTYCPEHSRLCMPPTTGSDTGQAVFAIPYTDALARGLLEGSAHRRRGRGPSFRTPAQARPPSYAVV